ncbi:hypothetical protein OJ997_31720 [Solirubrobacter phytolaccae]|uniref:Uncharacterized protein n=1 Tax=Solirubrobacter phytolaccae TaxID=1404360 RepID=A0A9X3NDY7_9ACTN|nr:hypothetical protein [Solirubrobacter phytolaccae]MDA0184915.1 hypothetical protein [Solirubrobacter phytolaccae]
MGWFRREKPIDVVAELVEMGAPPDTAAAIVAALGDAGLTEREAQIWVSDPERAYPHNWPMEMGDQVIMMAAGTRFLITQGKADDVLKEAREFAEASPDERAISRLFWGSLDDARRLTGCSPERAAVIADIARTIRERVGSDQDVCYVGQTVLPGTEDRRIVDRLLDGEEQAVRDELTRGELNPKRLLKQQPLRLRGW